MRPLRLEVEGFTSFREKQRLDFSGLDLFAVTGPTGAGKSSLIDAIVFALYGQVPRVGDDYKQLISHGAERLNVLLEFGVGKERYRVVRTARRAGPSQQRLERLNGTGPEPLADRVREIRDRMGEILGLDYDGFTRAVVLPQGQFDAFLKGEPKERRKILVTLLRLGVYDDMLKIANQRSAAARQECAFVSQQLERDFADATEERRAALAADVAGTETEARSVDAALAAVEEGLALARTVRTARHDVCSLSRDLTHEEGKRRAAEELLAGADEERAALERESGRLAGRIGALGFDEARHTVLAGARPRAEQLLELRRGLDRLGRTRDEVARALAAGKAAIADAEGAVAAAEAARKEAEEEARSARVGRDEAHRRHAALALRRDLRPGEACPVCARKVTTVPKGAEPALDDAERRLRDAEARAGSAQGAEQHRRTALEKARAEAASRAAEIEQLDERGEESSARAAAVETALAEAGFGDEDRADPGALVSRIGEELRSLEAARRTRAELEALRAGTEKARSMLDARIAAAAAERDGARQRLEGLAARHAETTAALDAALLALGALAGREGWGAPALPAPGRDEVDVLETCRAARQAAARDVASRLATLRQQLAQIEEKVARAAELSERRTALEKDASLLKTLADHLRANELVAWIQEEALERLAEDGTAHLTRLSQGRYALRLGAGGATEAGAKAEQDFFVVDRWSADSVRSVRTLSGGETFLASLALALALAESLAELSAEGLAGEVLESLFLDEGFGSLDAETLDVVVDALDALHGGERMVGIVTHMRELAERLPARLEVRKSAATATAAVV